MVCGVDMFFASSHFYLSNLATQVIVDIIEMVSNVLCGILIVYKIVVF